ncbi:hypothetical protein [Cytobacillus gottheilii]|uniref:hypothetical protein n=1 Tax=Cytobacillus gottheilii TaxID=859144 RepID=UPI0009BA8E35|nr:hypothetical protein [Cytobacillus gottheilii]
MKKNLNRIQLELNEYNHLTIKTNNGEVTLTRFEIDQIVKAYDQMKQEKVAAKPTISIEDKIKECKEHGFKVRKDREWLWLSETDGRYNVQVTTTTGEVLTNKDKETEVLESLGFQYSSNKMNFYWIS